MTRDEWMVLPDADKRFRRDAIVSYGSRPDGGMWLNLAGVAQDIRVDITLAEFEALLFGPAEGDEYTRAAVETAEAEAAWWHGDLGDPKRRHMLHRAAQDAREAFFRLYRGRHDAQR